MLGPKGSANKIHYGQLLRVSMQMTSYLWLHGHCCCSPVNRGAEGMTMLTTICKTLAEKCAM